VTDVIDVDAVAAHCGDAWAAAIPLPDHWLTIDISTRLHHDDLPAAIRHTRHAAGRMDRTADYRAVYGALADDLYRRFRCPGCHGTLWVEDENWSSSTPWLTCLACGHTLGHDTNGPRPMNPTPRTRQPDPVMTPVRRVAVGDRIAPAAGWSSTPDRVVTAVDASASSLTRVGRVVLTFDRVPGLPRTAHYDATDYVPVRPRSAL
jgi:ribosomal protein S27E